MSERWISAKFQVATPLFSGGADPNQTELRIPSLKGVLRFWWRALAWSHYGGDLGRVKREEDCLFGCGGKDSRRSKVIMRLGSRPSSPQVKKGEKLKQRNNSIVGPGTRYLGYGLMKAFGPDAGVLTKGCLEPLEFELQCRCIGLSEETFALLCRAIEMMGTVGGVGARSRRGFGSLVLTQLTEDKRIRTCGSKDESPTSLALSTAPATLRELGERIKALTSTCGRADLPGYTAFSAGTRHLLVAAGPSGPSDPLDPSDPMALLDRIGRELLRFRAYGKDGKVLGDRAERLFSDDHDLMRSVVTGDRATSHPRRIAFGLPHNYFFSSDRKKAGVSPARWDRRASPLFIHIHRVGDASVGVLSFLPAIFLPREDAGGTLRAKIKVGPNSRVSHAEEGKLYKVINDFLDRVKSGCREQFSRVLEVSG